MMLVGGIEDMLTEGRIKTLWEGRASASHTAERAPWIWDWFFPPFSEPQAGPEPSRHC